MVTTETMLIVGDVEASAHWYCALLGATNDHGGPYFDRVVLDGEVLLLLHHRGGDGHPALQATGPSTAGAGVLVYVVVPDLDEVFRRARALGAETLDTPHDNERSHQREFSLLDPDGHALTICQRS